MTRAEPTPGSSWTAATLEHGRLAAADDAHEAARGVMRLMAAAHARGTTVQWMPDDQGKGCRFEIIGANTGDFLGIAYIDEEGRVTFNG